MPLEEAGHWQGKGTGRWRVREQERQSEQERERARERERDIHGPERVCSGCAFQVRWSLPRYARITFSYTAAKSVHAHSFLHSHSHRSITRPRHAAGVAPSSCLTRGTSRQHNVDVVSLVWCTAWPRALVFLCSRFCLNTRLFLVKSDLCRYVPTCIDLYISPADKRCFSNFLEEN